MKELFYFSIAVLFSILLIWFGTKFLFFPNDHLSSTGYFVSGTLIILGGILFLGAPEFRKLWWVGAILVAIGMYFFGRASGTISQPWLARALGSASWLAATALIYVTWPRKRSKDSSTTNTLKT